MSSGVTTLRRLLDPEDARVMIFLNVHIVAVSSTPSLNPQHAVHVSELSEGADFLVNNLHSNRVKNTLYKCVGYQYVMMLFICRTVE
jgi:hypothetical protein